MFEEMRKYQNDRKFLNLEKRRKNLMAFKKTIKENKADILKALQLDLDKNPNEGFLTEYLMVMEELNFLIKNFNKLAKPQRVRGSLFNFPSKTYIYKEPYGLVLIVAPWNYPFNLSMIPFLGALAGGNSVVLKPSKKAPATSEILKKIVEENCPPEIGQVVNGKDGNDLVMKEKFDYIFFTGGLETGRKFYKKAAEDLVPITLELGGKSPALICPDADIKISAKRIAFGKFLNSGQTCVSVDYAIVHESLVDDFIKEVEENIHKFFGADPLKSNNYGKIIGREDFERITNTLKKAGLAYRADEKNLKISPLVARVNKESPLMEREIFGPILPVITYKNISEPINFINSGKTPLAFYVFSKDIEAAKELMEKVSFGGGAINDTINHIVGRAPFGGFRESGLGSYHGIKTFETFIHKKTVLDKALKFDSPFRYPGADIRVIKKFYK